MARSSAKRSPARSPRGNRAGRAKPRNPDRTKGVILGAATSIFAERGYSGGSINDIVDECGFNKRMIYHYFGDKEGLYRAVILQQWIELKDWVNAEMSRTFEGATAPVDTAGILRDAIRICSRFMAERQEFVRLAMWDGLEGGKASNSIWKEARGPLFAQVEFFLQQAKDEGLLSPELANGHFVVSFLGALSFYFAYAPTLKEMIGKDPLSREALKEREEHLVRLLESVYLRPPAERPDARSEPR